jgi:tetraacyldisaccharide 4'-kinase
MREPPFWWRKAGMGAALLAPVAQIYGTVARLRLTNPGRRTGVPVVCIGNPTVGGAGKTPLALAVVRMLAEAGERPALLSRGYGGSLPGPLRVDPARHCAADVGDEPLLLARAAPTMVARDRIRGAAAAVAAGASVVVMDDGFQNPSLAKDFSVLVVDSRRGIGNGRVIPAGPLRAPLEGQLACADALVIVGGAPAATMVLTAARTRGVPAFAARLDPDPRFIAAHGGSRVLAFAGIGDPEKFFATLAEAGVAVAAARAFPDHHRYTRADALALCRDADRDGLVLVTTEKDAARLERDADVTELAQRARALPVSLTLADAAAFRSLVMQKLAAARERSTDKGTG